MKSENIVINENGFTVNAYFADPELSAAPGIIIIHEIWGLNENTRDIASRFAAEGYAALAPDLMTGEVNDIVDPSILRAVADPATRDEAQKRMREALAPTQTPAFAQKTVAKLRAAFQFLKRLPSYDGCIGVVGFCFGGTYAFALAANEPELKFSIPFYGHPPAPETIPSINCPILAFYGEKDDRLMQTLPDLEAAMEKNKKQFRCIVYPGVGHAFFNDKNPMLYNAEAAAKAWEEVKRFLKAAAK